MASKKPPISGRDLIRHLPELLTGRDPVIDDPAIQRFITNDPEGRAAIGLIAETATSLTVAYEPTGLDAPEVNKTVRDAVLASRKYARRKLADLLFYEACRRIQAALHSRGETIALDYLWKNDSRPTESAIQDANVEELCRSLGMGAEAIARLKAELAVPTGSDERVSAWQMRSAAHLLLADVSLVPNRDGSTFARHAAVDYSKVRKSASEWMAIANTLTAEQARSCALDRALLCHLERQAWDRGKQLVDELGARAPYEPTAQSHCLVMALGVGNERQVRRVGDALEVIAMNDPSTWQAVSGPMLWHANWLRTATATRRREARRLVALLPASIQALPWRLDK